MARSRQTVALSEEDKLQGRRLDQLDWSGQEIKQGWGMSFPVQLIRQVFTNKDGSTGILYLACSEADWNTITTTYQKRWQVEIFHKSLKSNAAMSKSPAIVSQANHLFASIVAVFKLEKLKIVTHLNHFSLKTKLYVNAIQAAYAELKMLRSA